MMLVFVLGLIFGSFYNILIIKTLNEENFISSSSRCTNCDTPIEWKYKTPIFFYLFLKDRYKYCNKPIDTMYPIIELITGVMLLFLYTKFGISIKLVMSFACLSLFLILAGMDIKSNTISQKYAIILILCCLFSNFNNLHDSFWGGLLCFCLMKIVLWLSTKFNKNIIGDGDLYGVTALGVFLGLSHITFLFIVLVLFSGIIALPKFIKQTKNYLTLSYFVWFILAYIPVFIMCFYHINSCLLIKILINVNLFLSIIFLSKEIIKSLLKSPKVLSIPLYPSIFFTALLFSFLF